MIRRMGDQNRFRCLQAYFGQLAGGATKEAQPKGQNIFFFSSMVTFITFHFSWERGSTEDDNFLSMQRISTQQFLRLDAKKSRDKEERKKRREKIKQGGKFR